MATFHVVMRVLRHATWCDLTYEMHRKSMTRNIHLLLNWSWKGFVTGLWYLQKFVLGESGSHNLENEEISGGAFCHNTEFSPQSHALIKTFHIEINVVGLQISFLLLNF